MFAHSCNFAGDRHDLVQHLRTVADLARSFGANFDAADPAHYAGLWHDLGKFHPDFQAYLRRCEAAPSARGYGPEHKGAGALLASQHLAPLSLLIHGHHGGLRSMADTKNWVAGSRGDGAVHAALEAARRAIPDLEPAGVITLPEGVEQDKSAAELLLRLLFSALVDADYLDTERHFDPERSIERTPPEVPLHELWARFERNHASLSHRPESVVDQARKSIHNSAIAAAEQPPGIFRLTVPTGGGKTLSGMAFALRHALRHGLKRVIVAAPYGSITDQTAKIYREIFGTDTQGRPVVLEHHSQATVDEDESGDFHRGRVRTRLAAENWDVPIVVTTTVQLLESLFSNATSRMRKVHRLAGSVIIIDEAQAMPPHLLEPILDALRQLTTWGRSTVVLSTATQPTFEAIQPFANLNPVEIVPDPSRWFDALRRVTYEWSIDEASTWDAVAQRLRGKRQGLAVVNLKRDAFDLLDALDDPDALHLSTQLCGAHRIKVIQEVRDRLRQGQPCRLVSTQVIEAGVDLDFPFVLRALAPLDGIIQAAGRCNREGSLEKGRVIVFRPEGQGSPPGAYRTATQVAQEILGGGMDDLDNPKTAQEYFRRLFQTMPTDRERIQERRGHFDFPEVAQRFRMIDDDTESLVITDYGTEEERQRVGGALRSLRDGAGGRYLLRELQPYIVSVRTRKANDLRQKGLVGPIANRIGVWRGRYDPVRGLMEAGMNPDDLVV